MAKKINLVAADMGYGHQRAAYPLLNLSDGEIITINNYVGIPDWEKKYWVNSLRSYERISRFKKVPLLGTLVFAIMDYFQKIQPFYPFRDLSAPTAQQKYFFRFIKKGLGRALIEKLNKTGLPFVTTFFVVAYMAEYHNYQGDIYCIICDTDASRAWAPLDPKNSRVKFLLPSDKVKTRFLMYGVKPENLFVTGFPLPLENIGANQEILKQDLARRLVALDPKGNFRATEKELLNSLLPPLDEIRSTGITITFAVGGAGAQKEIGALLIKQSADQIKLGQIKINLVAGNRSEIKDYFTQIVRTYSLDNSAFIKIIFAAEKTDYFKKFNECLHSTDILWTKPSELSFYCALGLPVIISNPVGSQEDFNREWLLSNGAGLDSPEPQYVKEWLPEFLESGRLARAALAGFLEAEAKGAYKIEKLIIKK